MEHSPFGRIKRRVALHKKDLPLPPGECRTREQHAARGSRLLGRAMCAPCARIREAPGAQHDGSWTRLERGYVAVTQVGEEGESHLGDWQPALDKHLLAPPLEPGVSPHVGTNCCRRHS